MFNRLIFSSVSILIIWLLGQSAHAEEIQQLQIEVPVNATTMTCNEYGALFNWPGLQNIAKATHQGLLGQPRGDRYCQAPEWIKAANKTNGFLNAEIKVSYSLECEPNVICRDPWDGSTCVGPGDYLVVQREHVRLHFTGTPSIFDFFSDWDGNDGVVSGKFEAACPGSKVN